MIGAVIVTGIMLPEIFQQLKSSFLFQRTTPLSRSDSGIETRPDNTEKQVVLYEESHALVIWGGNYQHWNKLSNLEEEAKQVGKTLERQGFIVHLVGNPTGSELRSTIKNFIDNYGYEYDNRLVIFFTGHGHTRNRTKGYLVPIDAPDPIIDERGFLKTALPMEQLIGWASMIESKHVLFVFDSCFAGTVFKSPVRINFDVNSNLVRQFITSGDAEEEVLAESKFTPLFIRGLEGAADYDKDGYVTGRELGLYITQTMAGYYDDIHHPQYGNIAGTRGDILFRVVP